MEFLTEHRRDTYLTLGSAAHDAAMDRVVMDRVIALAIII